MHQEKSVCIPLGPQFKLSASHSPKTNLERKYMSKPSYANVVGSLMYAMVCSRPDLAYTISVISRVMANPGRPDWDALKWTMRYLNETTSLGLLFEKVDSSK